MWPAEVGSALEIRRGRFWGKGGQPRAERAREREDVGKVASWEVDGVANNWKASRISDSVDEVMLCSLASLDTRVGLGALVGCGPRRLGG